MWFNMKPIHIITAFLSFVIFPQSAFADLLIFPFPFQERLSDDLGAALIHDIEPAAGHEFSSEHEANLWSVKRSDSLQDILQRWSDMNGTLLLWDMDGYYLEASKTMDINASYEDAVNAILSEFNGLEGRPVGTIYQDAQVAKKVLVISPSDY